MAAGGTEAVEGYDTLLDAVYNKDVNAVAKLAKLRELGQERCVAAPHYES